MEAWGPAIQYWTDLGLDRIAAYERELTVYAAERIAAIPRVRLIGTPKDRISIVSFVIDGMEASDVAKALEVKSHRPIASSGRDQLLPELRSSREHTHHPVDDAIEQAEIFARLYD